MNKLSLIFLVCSALVGCKQRGNNAQTAVVVSSDPEVVNVLYFHPEQGCTTCKAVGSISKKIVEAEFVGKKVAFVDVDFSKSANKAVVEKHEIVSSSLIIAKGSDKIDVTMQAFATALNNPQALEKLVKDEINKRLQ
jgi:hypothetical protein